MYVQVKPWLQIKFKVKFWLVSHHRFGENYLYSVEYARKVSQVWVHSWNRYVRG